MNIQKLLRIIGLGLIIWLLSACGSTPTEPATVPTPVPTATMEATTVSVEPGFITGRVHGQAPPTPAMVVYAVDNTTGSWTFIETQETDGEAPFTLEVSPGSYQVFAFSRDGVGPYAGYSEDGLALAAVTVEAGQTVSDIIVRPPSMSECGPTFGLPASPDGRFAAIDGPAEDCQAAATAEPAAIVELPDGARCFFAGTGATLAFDGKRLNYTCDVEGEEVGLLGDLQQQSDGTLTAEKVVIGHNDSGFFIKASEEVIVQVINEDAVAGMPNPASVFCEEQGGQLEIRSESGGEVGYCIFPDGSECEEWAFFRGECLLPSSTVCSELADDVTQTLGVDVTMSAQIPFEDYISGQTGTGCQLAATGTGLDFENVGVVSEALATMLQGRGWQEDIQYAGGGPTGLIAGYRQADALCLLQVGWDPSEEANCPADQPIDACELLPEQKQYTITLNCAQDMSMTAGVPLPKTEPARIQFAPGAISSQVQGSLAAGGLDPYVLTAMAGQEMTVNLTTAGDSAEVSAILVIWGADGAVLLSDHADATTWNSELPLTQDYYIDVSSVAQTPVDYTLEVIIPPVTEVSEVPEILPLDVPIGFEFLFGLAESLMLPPEFPVEAGLPAVQPYVITAEPDEYEISLDFGPDCRGAGACHYGSLAGKKVTSNEPVSTRNFIFEAERAQKVTLANGIEGYFIEAFCGASCDDAKIFWIYNGFQYMIGLKGSQQSAVVDLANAAITNSLWSGQKR